MSWSEVDESMILGYNMPLDLWSDREGALLPKKAYDLENDDLPYLYHGNSNVDGWNVYEMESGEYPDHDAILLDRNNKTIMLNYQGHHAPMFEQFGDMLNKYNTNVAGHFRSSPSTTEPFPAGWGWHGDVANPEEKKVLKKILKNHYQIKALKDLYTPNDDAEENWLDLEDESEPEDKTSHLHDLPSPPKFRIGNQDPKVEWLDNDTKTLTWKGIYDILGNKLFLWSVESSGLSGEPHHWDIMQRVDFPQVAWTNSVQLAGFYTKPDFRATYVGEGVADPALAKQQAYQLLIPALQQRWPERLGSIPTRFLMKEDGEAIFGDVTSHYNLLLDHGFFEGAEQYRQFDLGKSEVYPFITGGQIKNAIMYLTRSSGEEEFDPRKIAKQVFVQAESEGIVVNGEVFYKDDNTGHIDIFNVDREASL